jgi:hypothetical protein
MASDRQPSRKKRIGWAKIRNMIFLVNFEKEFRKKMSRADKAVK